MSPRARDRSGASWRRSCGSPWRRRFWRWLIRRSLERRELRDDCPDRTSHLSQPARNLRARWRDAHMAHQRAGLLVSLPYTIRRKSDPSPAAVQAGQALVLSGFLSAFVVVAIGLAIFAALLSGAYQNVIPILAGSLRARRRSSFIATSHAASPSPTCATSKRSASIARSWLCTRHPRMARLDGPVDQRDRARGAWPRLRGFGPPLACARAQAIPIHARGASGNAARTAGRSGNGCS